MYSVDVFFIHFRQALYFAMNIDLSSINTKHYLSGAIIIGIAQSIDSLVALTNIYNVFTTAFSLIELTWFLVSVFYLLVFRCQQFSQLLPTLYIVYYLFGWFYGSYLLTIQLQPTLILPVWYKLFAGVFGVGYFSYAFYFYRLQKLSV